MPVKKYDVIFSLGSACLCSQTLRKLHLQFCSYPLDWITGDDFSNRIDLLASGFKDFFNKEDFALHPEWKETKTDVYKNKRTGIIFPHDFPRNIPLESSYPDVKAKYDRRISRLIGNIEKNDRILIVYIDKPAKEQNAVSDETLKNGHARIVSRFPEKHIDLLYVFCSDDVREQKIGDHIFKFSFDYAEDGTPPYRLLHLRAFLEGRYKLKQSLHDRMRSLVFKIGKKIKKARANRCSNG